MHARVSSSLPTVIPPFHAAVDRAVSYLDKNEGLLGVADFYVSSKYDLPLRQMPWMRRFFWRCGDGDGDDDGHDHDDHDDNTVASHTSLAHHTYLSNTPQVNL